MGKKSASKKQNRKVKQSLQATTIDTAKGAVAKDQGVSLQQAIKAPTKHQGLQIDSAHHVRKDIRLISFLLIGMFAILTALTIANNQTGFVTETGQHLSAFLKF